MTTRRAFTKKISLAALSVMFNKYLSAATGTEEVPESLREEMYAAALKIAKSKIRGGKGDPVFPKPFPDAAFSTSIYYWDTCFIASVAKYHPAELPAGNALDNFYRLQEPDGYICREYMKDGKAFWPKDHPVSVNPPLLGFAELELYSTVKDTERLRRVYPALKKHFEFLRGKYQMDDGLFFSDAFGSGMDNIARYPFGWKDDGKGIVLNHQYSDIFSYSGLSPRWNIQGRSVDMSAQMCLFAENLRTIALLTGHNTDVVEFESFYDDTKNAINSLCWNEEDRFYYDLGYGIQIRRKHVGMFWTLISGVVPEERIDGLLKSLQNPLEFGTKVPVASLPANSPDYVPAGGYWRGGVWAPANYMILLGLKRYGRGDLARNLARRYYYAVAEVYKTTKTFWENYSPAYLKAGDPARPDFCGWTAIAPVTIYHEFIKS